MLKLRRLCAEVGVLSGNPALAEWAPVVEDLHPVCGPMGGIEAALTGATFKWNLILPVDVPFLPVEFLGVWVRGALQREDGGCRLSVFRVDGVPQPALLMVHHDVLPYLSAAISRGEYKLFPVLVGAADDLARKMDVERETVLWEPVADGGCGFPLEDAELSEAQRRNVGMWFANLNTPEEFAEAERYVDTLGA